MTRRNVVYTVKVFACSIDDPSDGAGVGDATFCETPLTTTVPGSPAPGAAASVNVLGIAVVAGGSLLQTVCNALGVSSITSMLSAALSPVAPLSACPSGSTSTAPYDSTPEDLRRVRIDVSWNRRGAGTVSQTTLLTNPAMSATMPDFSSPQREDGFTLVEVLVAMLISTIVLLATLQSVDLFTTNAAQQTRDTDANGQLRLVMDRTVRDLRSSSQILKAAANDLVYAVPAEREHARRAPVRQLRPAVRLELDDDRHAGCARRRLLGRHEGRDAAVDGVSTRSPTTAPPPLRPPRFRASRTSASRSISTPAAAARPRSARSARAPRGAPPSGLPLTDTDLETKCGNNSALLNLSADVPGVAGMTVTYTDVHRHRAWQRVRHGHDKITLPPVKTTVIATIVDSLGVTKLLSKDVQCD